MQIPVLNIYYLLCYAWDKLPEGKRLAIQPESSTTLIDLFAQVLIGGINHIIKKGFDRGYVHYSDETRSIKGRVDFSTVLKRNLLQKGFVQSEYDELSYNIHHNRILKTTARNLIKTRTIDPKLKEQLSVYYHRLHEIDDIELSGKVFNRITINRNNSFYLFLMNICEIIYHNLLPTEQSGEWQFKDFIQDEKQMRTLFEEFVRNFYKNETKKFVTSREKLKWQLTPEDSDHDDFVPQMRPDITLTGVDRKIIIECKFTPNMFQEYYGAKKFVSEHLYQLNAYRSNLPEIHLNRVCQFILLYPTTDIPIMKKYKDTKNRDFIIRTINLNQPWRGIHNDLIEMIA